MTGATTTPVNSRYRSRSPTLQSPAMIARPPMTIISAPMTPTAREAADVVADTPVTVVATFRSSLCHALGEHPLLALLDVVGLDDAHPPEGLGEPPRHLRVDLPALAEQGPQPRERHRHRRPEDHEDEQGHRGQAPVQVEEHPDAEGRGDEPARELGQPRPDEVADALGVGHHPRDEDAGLRRVEVADGQPRHVPLHALAHLGDGPLRRHSEHLGQREPRPGLDHRGPGGGEGEGHEEIGPPLGDDVVDDVAGHPRQDEAGEPADEHQGQAPARAGSGGRGPARAPPATRRGRRGISSGSSAAVSRRP